MSEKSLLEAQQSPFELTNPIPTLLTVRQLASKHPFMSQNSIRWLLFKNPPGLEECLIRVAKRIYIEEAKYFDFLRNHKTTLKGL